MTFALGNGRSAQHTTQLASNSKASTHVSPVAALPICSPFLASLALR